MGPPVMGGQGRALGRPKAAEEADSVTSRGRERDGRGTHLVLYEEPLREGEGASRPSGRSSVVGESNP